MSSKLSPVLMSDDQYWLDEAKHLIEQEQFQRALEYLHRGGEGKQLPDNYVLQAICLLHLNRPEEALQICDRALAIASNYPQAWLFRGIALHRLGHYQDAYKCYEAATNQPQGKQKSSGNQCWRGWFAPFKFFDHRLSKHSLLRHWVN